MFELIKKNSSEEKSRTLLQRAASSKKSLTTNSLRLIMQCCADLQNSHAIGYVESDWTQTVAAESLKEFDDLVKSSETGKFNITMEKYLKFRRKLSETCVWD